jgi:ribosomal protein S7
MIKVARHITDKYKSTRLQPDSLYASRLRQTFFNKFTKKGEKAKARRHILKALQTFRCRYRRLRRFTTLHLRFESLHRQFLLIARRKGSKIISIPVPVRRNKRDTIALQTFYAAVTARRERDLHTRIAQELYALSPSAPIVSKTLHARSAHNAKVYVERT